MTRTAFVILVCALSAGCAARSAPPAASGPGASATPTHENLNAVLWMQTAIEYEAAARQSYRLAQLQLDRALQDPRWTAAIEQTGDASQLPPAVIVDIDETTLDNSYYQARLIRDGSVYATATWDPWVAEMRATAVPGSLEFAKYAAGKGVTVFYLTNRTRNIEEATRRNLASLGFPLRQDVDTVLTRGERDWQASEKAPRRTFVAQGYRILLLIGDDLGDFVPGAAGTVAQRRERAAAYADWWGGRWIMLPNPAYGSWERALIGDSTDPLDAKRHALKYGEGKK